MASGFGKKETVETEKAVSVEPVVEPQEKPLSDNVIENVLAVLGQTFDLEADAQKAVNAPNCSYFQYKFAKYNSLQLCQVRTQWAWIAF